MFGCRRGENSTGVKEMKLYDSKSAPNPRRTRIFLAEKGITLPTEQVDIMAKQHKTPEYTAINPLQRMPSLVLDDGTVITESIAICRYFEVLQPRAAAVRRRRQGDRAGGNVEPALRDQFLGQCGGRVPPSASGDEGLGSAAGAGLCRGHAAARALVSRTAGQGIGQRANSSPATAIRWPTSPRWLRSIS